MILLSKITSRLGRPCSSIALTVTSPASILDVFLQVVDEKAIRKADQCELSEEIYSPYVPPSAIMPIEMLTNLEAALEGDATLAAVAQDPGFPSWVGGYSSHASHFEIDPVGVSGWGEWHRW